MALRVIQENILHELNKYCKSVRRVQYYCLVSHTRKAIFNITIIIYIGLLNE